MSYFIKLLYDNIKMDLSKIFIIFGYNHTQYK